MPRSNLRPSEIGGVAAPSNGSRTDGHLMTIEEVAEFLSVKKSTIYAFVHQGVLPHFKVGRLTRFRQSDIDGWLEARKVEGRSRQELLDD